eukprot:gene4702-3368_t
MTMVANARTSGLWREDNETSTCSTLTNSPMLSPLIANPVSFDVRVVFDENEEEVWFIDESVAMPSTEPAKIVDVPSPPTVAHVPIISPDASYHASLLVSDAAPKKRKFEEVSTSTAEGSETAAHDDHHREGDGDEESEERLYDEDEADGDDEDDVAVEDEEGALLDTVLTALRPFKYTAYRRNYRRLHRTPPIPKILKNDLRREYLTMFCHVVNSQDMYLLRDFFRQYCLPTLNFHHICVGNDPRVVDHRILARRDAVHLWKRFDLPEVFALWAVKFDLTPDLWCRIFDVKLITTRASGAVRLEGTFVVRKSQLFDVSNEKLRYLWLQKVLSGYYAGESYDAYVVQLHAERAANHCLGDIGATSPVVRDDGLYPLPLSAEPRLYTIEGRVIMNIDADRRIESMLLYPTSLDISSTPAD